MIIDAHAHVSLTEYGNTEKYLETLREAGIDRGIVVPGGMVDVRRMTAYITGDPPDSLVPDNAYVEQSVQAHPEQLNGFVCIDPHHPQAVETLEQAVRKGFRGLKLSPLTHQFSFTSKAVAALATLCGEKGIPLYTHVLYSPGASTAKFVELARQFPKTTFILGHMGFGPADPTAVEGAMLDNFYLETSTGNFLHIQEAVRKVGAEKVIFGSEYPLSHPVVEMQKILQLKISDDDREKILGGTIKQLLRL